MADTQRNVENAHLLRQIGGAAMQASDRISFALMRISTSCQPTADTAAQGFDQGFFGSEQPAARSKKRRYAPVRRGVDAFKNRFRISVSLPEALDFNQVDAAGDFHLCLKDIISRAGAGDHQRSGSRYFCDAFRI
jgi:hypothetical protein